MKRGFLILPVLLLSAPVKSHAFTLDIASHEIAEFSQGPRSIFVPGYGEVAFEYGLDGALVVDSAYASTDQIDLPPPSREPAAEPFTEGDEDPDAVKIANRRISLPSSSLHPVDASLQNPPEVWNAVPETASATLGLIGTLMLLLRRRVKTMATAPGNP